MNLPPLYKYLDAQGARLTLGNGTFRHAKPTDFNDTEELTVRSILPEKLDIALETIENSFIDILLEHLDDQPTCGPPMLQKLILIQRALRSSRSIAEQLKAELGKAPIYDRESMGALAESHIQEINEFCGVTAFSV